MPRHLQPERLWHRFTLDRPGPPLTCVALFLETVIVHTFEPSPDVCAGCSLSRIHDQHLGLNHIQEVVQVVGTIRMPMEFVYEL